MLQWLQLGPVLPGLTGNQLLGNQSIFDLENWLLAPPPSPLIWSCAPWKTDSEFSQASWMSCSQPKNTHKYNGHYVTSGGRGAQGSYSVQLLLLASVAFPLWHQSHNFWRRKTKAISFASSFNRNGLRLLDVEDNARHHCFEDNTRWLCVVEVYIHYQVWLQIPIWKCTQTSLLQWLAVITDGRIRTNSLDMNLVQVKSFRRCQIIAMEFPVPSAFLVNA